MEISLVDTISSLQESNMKTPNLFLHEYWLFGFRHCLALLIIGGR